MAAKRKRKKKTLRQRYVAFRRWQTRRAKAKAQAAKELNRLDRERQTAKAVSTKERAEHKERVQARKAQRRQEAERRYEDRKAQRVPVVMDRPQSIIVHQIQPAGQVRVRPIAASQCGAPTDDGSPCQRLAGPDGCGIDGHKSKASKAAR